LAKRRICTGASLGRSPPYTIPTSTRNGFPECTFGSLVIGGA